MVFDHKKFYLEVIICQLDLRRRSLPLSLSLHRFGRFSTFPDSSLTHGSEDFVAYDVNDSKQPLLLKILPTRFDED